MGIDIHEWRRFHGKADPNPAAYATRAGKASRNTAQANREKWQKFARTRKRRTAQLAFQAKIMRYGNGT